MLNIRERAQLVFIYLVVLLSFFAAVVVGDHTVTVLSQSAPLTRRKCVVIDAGHGGEDGGAVSCTGTAESKVNLEIAFRLNDLLHLMGIDTVMIRDTDRSVYTSGETLSAKKVSDLKERTRIINSTENAVLVSIHQNHFSDSRYSGAQVFYADTTGSQELARQLQKSLNAHLKLSSNRTTKKAESVYLMQHVTCTAVLVECGFLSNPKEEAKLRDPEYQKEICSVLAGVCSTYLYSVADVA